MASRKRRLEGNGAGGGNIFILGLGNMSGLVVRRRLCRIRPSACSRLKQRGKVNEELAETLHVPLRQFHRQVEGYSLLQLAPKDHADWLNQGKGSYDSQLGVAQQLEAALGQSWHGTDSIIPCHGINDNTPHCNGRALNNYLPI